MERYSEFLKKLDLRRDYGTDSCFMVMIASSDRESVESVANGQIFIVHRRENVDAVLRDLSGINLLALFSYRDYKLSRNQKKQIRSLSLKARQHLLPFSFFGEKDDDYYSINEILMFNIEYYFKDKTVFSEQDGYTFCVSEVVNVGTYKYSPNVVFEVCKQGEKGPNWKGMYCLPIHEFLAKVKDAPLPKISDCYTVAMY